MQTLRVACFVSLAFIAACGPADAIPDEATEAAGNDDLLEYENELVTKVSMHRLVEDADVFGGENVTVDQVNEFLRSKRSYLANYRDPAWNKTAAQLIVERGRASGIHPVYLLSRIQVESGLVQSGTSQGLAKATGCGCPDSGGCSRSYAGFGNQVDCAAKKIKNYVDYLDRHGQTTTGWKVGLTKSTLDPCRVKPSNRATAALFTYTPWVGAYAREGCGSRRWGGSTLVGSVYDRYESAQDWGGAPHTCQSDTLAKAVKSGVCVQSAEDAKLHQCNDGTWKLFDGARECTRRYPFCESSTLKKDVPARTCVQARSDREWYQCGENGKWVAATGVPTSGKGPLGTCSSVNEL